MLKTHAKANSLAPQGSGDTVIVDTRFGVYEFAPQSQITLPQGLVGMADMTHFGLANLPAPLSEDLKLLQSLSGDPLSFIVWATATDAAPIAAEDLAGAYEALGLDPASVALLFLVTVRSAAEGVAMSANLRAPVFLDLDKRQARQYVLSNEVYPLRAPFGEQAQAA